jgi:hypothetical protein
MTAMVFLLYLWLACVACRDGGQARLLSRTGDLSTWIYCDARMVLVLARSVGLVVYAGHF